MLPHYIFDTREYFEMSVRYQLFELTGVEMERETGNASALYF